MVADHYVVFRQPETFPILFKPGEVIRVSRPLPKTERETYVRELQRLGYMGPTEADEWEYLEYGRRARRLPPFWYGFAWLVAFLVIWGVLSWIGVL